MEQRELGASGLRTSAIGLGCMGFSQGYGATDDTASIAVIRGCMDAGVRMLDTAMSYGQGHNELLIGRVLKEVGQPADGIQIATKFGIKRGPDGVYRDGRPENVRTYCEESLQRLGAEVIDLYYLHRVDPGVPIAETVGAMADLVQAGKVRHLGVSEVTPEQLGEAAAVHPIAAVQFEWSLAWREPELELIPAARRLGIGLVPYSPLGRGLLARPLNDADIEASPFRKSDPRFRDRALDQNRAQVDALSRLAKTFDCSTSQLALAWLLAQGPDVVPIPGTRHLDRALDNLKAEGLRLTTGDLQRLDAAVPPHLWAGDRRSFAVPVTSRPIAESGSASGAVAPAPD